MRFSLFWRILAILTIPFLQVLLFAEIIKVPALESLIQQQNLVFILAGIFIPIIMAALTSFKYRQSIQQVMQNLGLSGKSNNKKRNLQKLPPEISDLFLLLTETNQKTVEMQAKLVKDYKMYGSILDNISDGILIADLNSNVSTFNKAASQLFHVDQKEALNHSLVEVVRDYRINELFEKCFKTHQQEIISFETAPDKSFIQCIATPLEPELPDSVLFLFQDLTRMRQLEIIRRDFVSNVSHELRTPLTSLKLITETLQSGALNDPADAKRFLEKMDGEVDNLTQLVEELLELSKIESGRVPLEKRYTKPEDLIKAACERMTLQVHRAGLTLLNTVIPELSSVLVDPPRLEQVLVNLLHNAIKFTSPGGRIEVSAYQESGFIVFFVKDNGKGIPPKDLERIFERFYKTDRSRSERGTGLGLSISRHLVEAHNGKIWAESQPGQGSTFYFQIPLQ